MPRTKASPALRRIARDSLNAFGLGLARLTHLANRHNDVFRIDTHSGKRYVLRIQNDLLSDAQALSQLIWLSALAEQTNIHVPAPVMTTGGAPFIHVDTSTGRRRAILLRWVEGGGPAGSDRRRMPAPLE